MAWLGGTDGRRGILAAALAAALAFTGSAVGQIRATGAPANSKNPKSPATRKATTKACPWVGEAAPPATRADQVLASMTLDDKLAMVHGDTTLQGFLGLPGSPIPTYAGEVAGNPRLCLPALTLEDGPAGIGDRMTGVTQLPAPVAAAATWDPTLVRDYGAVIGAEARGKGATVDLGPTVNIVRDPRWGRAFESLGEDPYLTSQTAVAEIQGIQGQGVMAQVKHLAAYNQETFRDTILDNVNVDERTLHEIYLPAFAASIRDGQVSSVMCSYNYLHGQPACGSNYLLNQVLKGELGFGGFVTSDWFATMSSAGAANAGLDMQMPDGCYLGTALERAVRTGQVPESRLNDMVRRILIQMFRFGLFDHPPSGNPAAIVTSPANANVAKTVAEAGSVLLKNEGGVLPLESGTLKSIAVIGGDAGNQATTGGGGSAAVNPPSVVSPFAGITKRAGSAVKVLYDGGSDPASAAATARSADVAIVFASLAESEGTDLLSIDLGPAQNAMIAAVARVNRHTVVVLNTGSAVTMPWVDSVPALVEAWYPGQQDGDAIAALLFGDINPAGKLPVTFPRSLSQVPANSVLSWPGLGGPAYSEDLNVGYRWYDAKGLTPLFPFGFGMSFTQFGFDHLSVTQPTTGTPATVSVDVTNTGHRFGSQVVQVYVSDPASAKEPPRQLKGFSKVSLAPGQTKRVSVVLDVGAFSHWDETIHQWVTDPGTYKLLVGDSSRSLPLQTSVTLPTTLVVSGTPTPTPTGQPSGQAFSDLLAPVTCPADVVAPAVNGAASLLAPLSLIPSG